MNDQLGNRALQSVGSWPIEIGQEIYCALLSPSLYNILYTSLHFELSPSSSSLQDSLMEDARVSTL